VVGGGDLFDGVVIGYVFFVVVGAGLVGYGVGVSVVVG